MDRAALEVAAGLDPDDAERLWREAQDEVLAELKGEVRDRWRISGSGAVVRGRGRGQRVGQGQWSGAGAEFRGWAGAVVGGAISHTPNRNRHAYSFH